MDTLNTTERPWDGWLLIIVCALLGLGVVMIYSASGITASWMTGDAFFYLKRQLLYLAFGFVFLIIGLKVDYRWYQRSAYPILGVTFMLLLLVLFIGTEVNGARRWIRLLGFNIQPAEVAKITMVFVLAYSMAKKNDLIKTFSIGILPHLLLIGLIVTCLMMQPDFGSSILITMMAGAMLFFAGTQLRFIIGGIVLCGLVGGLAITLADYRMKRILAFLDPWGTQGDEGYQLTRSLISIGSGGLEGRGLGQGLGKLGFVPELHTDFIGTAALEELGFFGALLIIALFIGFATRGFLIALHARDVFGRNVAFGLTFIITFQALFNLCVITGLVPTKGLTLPFVSYGGSSLLMCMFAAGVLLNISKCAEDTYAQKKAASKAEKERIAWEKKRERIIRESQQDRA
ncbi:MAG: putative lipid II flippase FtsW [Bradymonadia bacterium]